MGLRIALAGSRSFAAAGLERVLELGHDVPVVFAHDGDKLFNRALYDFDLPVERTVNEAAVRSADVDLILGMHTHDFIGRKSRGATRYGALVGHPSLLPRHRGRSSVEWTVRMRDAITGFTYFWADNGVDTGPIAAQEWCHVDPAWNASDLWREALFPLGIAMLEPMLKQLESEGQYGMWRPQDSRFATFEPSMEPTPLYRPELIPLPGPR